MIEVIYILFGKGLLLRKDHIKLNFYEHWDKSVSFNENNCHKKKPFTIYPYYNHAMCKFDSMENELILIKFL